MDSPDISAMVVQAYGQLKDGRFEDAIDAFSACLRLEPAQVDAYRGRAVAYFQLKQWPRAAADFAQAKALDAGEAEHWIGLAMSLAMDHKIYEAIEVFETFLAKHPQHVRAHIQLAQLYYRLGVIAKGHAQLDLALAARPSLGERRTIEQMQHEQLALDKRRYYRPDFEALRRNTAPLFAGVFRRLKAFFT